MTSQLISRTINLFIRSFTLLGKFLLVFFLARYLPIEEVALYGIIAASISFGLYFIGLDFHNYSSRELLKTSNNKWGKLLKSQAIFFILSYIILLPIFSASFYFEFIPWSLFFYVIPLLILEHISQELRRFLIITNKQTPANLMLFIRSGGWCVIASAFLFLTESTRNLEFILKLWILGDFISIIFGLKVASYLTIKGWNLRVNWNWILEGIKISIPLLISTLAIRGIFTIDKYWFESINSRSELAAYVFYLSISNALMSFLESGIFSHSYPKLIEYKISEKLDLFKKELRGMFLGTSAISILFIAFIYLTLPLILKFVGNSTYSENQDLLFMLLITIIAYAFSCIPNYGIYALGFDSKIVKSNTLSIGIFVATAFIISQKQPYWAIPISLALTFTALLVYKYYILNKLLKKNES